ncbi:uncharacterized protein LOC109836763 isoform X2 [Asparagus officinalis]|nr:uncharacterized protein LOC109836763 isoform X2 [Asparagus officinalis]
MCQYQTFDLLAMTIYSTFGILGIIRKVSVILLAILLALSYQAIKPPPPKICGSSGGPPVTSSRIKLRDGRNLSYIETGVPKDKVLHKIIFLHGLDSCKYNSFPISQEVMDEFGIYMASFDRAGYGESDPDPNRSVKSNAQDVEELADELDLGSKFFVIGYSMGGAFAWGCLKYFPHRLAGAALVAPVSNYWWPNFPSNLTKDVFSQEIVRDQWAYRVAHYAPWLTYWWNTQKWFPSSSLLAPHSDIFSTQDRDILPKLAGRIHNKEQARQQGEFGSLHCDMNIGFGSWEFDPMDLQNPFSNSEGSVHLWHGTEDRMVPVYLSRYISQKLAWVQYHELQNTGHMFPLADGWSDPIFKALVTGNQ